MTDEGTVTERRLDTVPLSHLRPDPRNPRTHKAAELRKSFGRFGYTNPIMLDERTGLIAAGHGRYELLTAMKAEGVAPPEGVICEYDDEGEEWYVPVVRGWASRDDDEALAYLIADNRQTELAEWAHPELAELLQPISETDRGLAGRPRVRRGGRRSLVVVSREVGGWAPRQSGMATITGGGITRGGWDPKGFKPISLVVFTPISGEQ